jgi:hypothetical protein
VIPIEPLALSGGGNTDALFQGEVQSFVERTSVYFRLIVYPNVFLVVAILACGGARLNGQSFVSEIRANPAWRRDEAAWMLS